MDGTTVFYDEVKASDVNFQRNMEVHFTEVCVTEYFFRYASDVDNYYQPVMKTCVCDRQ